MKPIKEITVHPYLGNDVRPEVLDWCLATFNDQYAQSEGDYRWRSTSNYNRSYDGTFDIMFKTTEDAHWFILRWGGDVVNIEYEEVPEQYVVRDDVYNVLFE
jgi:hypothetical protein